MKVSRLLPVLILIILATSLASCFSPLNRPDTPPSGLSITIGDNLTPKMLLPPLLMIPCSYTILGTGPGTASFTATTTGDTVLQTKLELGVWFLTIQASNAEGRVIGSGEGTATVVNGATSAVTIVVSPILGTGILDLKVSWPVGGVPKASITATLSPTVGNEGPKGINFAISGDSASFNNPSITNGYYTLTLVISSNGIIVGGAADIIRIVTGQTTAGTYIFSTVNTPGGGLTFTVTQNFFEPLLVSISGAEAYQSVGSSQKLSGSVSNPPADGLVNFTWFVNGVNQGVGPTLSFGSVELMGAYRVDLIGLSTTGTRSGSSTANVQIVPSIPTLTSVAPLGLSIGVNLETAITATFSEPLASVPAAPGGFTLQQGTNLVPGILTFTKNIATFKPTSALLPTTKYTATLTTGVTAATGVPLAANQSWSFTTLTPPLGPPAVLLGGAGSFTVLASTGAAIGAGGSIAGNIGLTAAPTAGFTGFVMTRDENGSFSTSRLVSGNAYDTSGTGTTPAFLTTASSALTSAIADASGRTPSNNTNVGAGELGGANFVPGLYKWTTAASITTNMSLQGGPNDVWIFQVAGALSQAANTTVTLNGAINPANVFWQVGGASTIGAGANFSGIVLSSGVITAGANAVIKGRLFSLSTVGMGAGIQVTPPGL